MPSEKNQKIIMPDSPEFMTLYAEKLQILADEGIFILESGQVSININNNQFQTVFVNEMRYKRSSQTGGNIPV